MNRGAWSAASATPPTQTQDERDMAMAVGLNWPCLAIKAFVKPRLQTIDPSANCRAIYTNAKKTVAKVELDTAEGVTHGRIIADAAIKENPFDWLVVVEKVEE
jgi:hypothetical protein